MSWQKNQEREKMNKFFLLLFGILFISFVSSACFPNYKCGEWGVCEEDLSSRTCVDTSCGAKDIIERQFCGDAACDSKIECGDWSSCNYFDKTNDIIEEKLIFEGSKERICYDKENCVSSFVEVESCSASTPVKVKKTTWCGKELVEIFDNEGNTVGRVQETQVTKKVSRVDISFLRENSPDYCGYCFDKEQNFDETGLDCGGPYCPECVPIIEYIDWAFIVAMFSWGIFGLLFLSGLFVLGNEENFSEGIMGVLRLFKPLTREEALAREGKIKDFVASKKISSEGFKS